MDVRASLVQNTSFASGEGMEFLLALLNIAALERISASRKAGEIDSFDEAIYSNMTDMKSQMSDYLRAELAHFFGSTNVALPIFSYALETFPYSVTPIELIAGLREQTALSFLRQARSVEERLIDHGGTGEGDRTWLIEDRHAQETKHRLVYLLETFYADYYVRYQDQIDQSIAKSTECLKAVFFDDPEAFYLKYLSIHPETFVGRACIHVSAFLQSSLLILQPEKAGAPTWIAIGGNIEENKQAIAAQAKETALRFLKLMSDKTRYDMVLLLAQRHWYNEELANYLGIAPATANYHLAAMLELDVVTMARDQHRMYYSLDDEKFCQLLHHIQLNLLGNTTRKQGE